MSRPALTAGGLAVGYVGHPVEGLTLELAPGATLAVLGTNGSGKSTLVKTVAGLLAPVAGALPVLGRRPGAEPARVSYLGQAQATGFVLPPRAIGVVAMGRFPARGLLGRMTGDDRRLVREAMARMGVEDLAGRGARQPVRRPAPARAPGPGPRLARRPPDPRRADGGARPVGARAAGRRAHRGAAARCRGDRLHPRHLGRPRRPARAAAGPARGRLRPPAEVLTREAVMETFGLVLAELPGGSELVMDPMHRQDHHEAGHT